MKKHFLSQKLQCISRKLQIISEKFQNSGKFRNNTINDAKQISSNDVIKLIMHYFFTCVMRVISTSKCDILITSLSFLSPNFYPLLSIRVLKLFMAGDSMTNPQKMFQNAEVTECGLPNYTKTANSSILSPWIT